MMPKQWRVTLLSRRPGEAAKLLGVEEECTETYLPYEDIMDHGIIHFDGRYFVYAYKVFGEEAVVYIEQNVMELVDV